MKPTPVRSKVPSRALCAAAALMLVALMPLPSTSDTHTVRQDGSGQFTSIQVAVEACSEGDTVLVGPGSYVPPGHGINPGGVNITIISEEGPHTTTVDATGRTRAFYYHTFEDASDRLANDSGSPTAVTYDYGFATDITKAAVALLAREAVLVSGPAQH